MEFRGGTSVEQLEAVASIARAKGLASEAHAGGSEAGGAETGSSAEAAPASAPVWDAAVRIFHWGLVTAVTVSWLTGGSGNRAHEITGFSVLGLVLFRLAWGFIGTPHALFRDFVRSPRNVLKYLQEVRQMRAQRHLGHNPAGGAMILVMVGLLLLICVTGYMQITPSYFGVVWVENLHHYSANSLVALIPLHVLGVIVSSWTHQENLVGAMVSGEKRDESALQAVDLRDAKLLQRVRGSEGLLMLLLIVGASAGYGVYATSGRSAAVPVDVTTAAAPVPAPVGAVSVSPPPAPAPVLSTPVAAEPQTRIAAPRTAVDSMRRTEFQDFVVGGPDRASAAWLISSGGRLYDRWYAALDIAPPETTHPSWPADNRNVSGPETWRCKTCHGWDYQGREGQYRSGPSASGAPSLARVRNRSVEDIMVILGGPKHQYSEDMLPTDAKFRLALFVREGQHVAKSHIAEDGTVRGNVNQGKAVFETICASCHGFDGRQRLLGLSKDPAYSGPPMFVGTKAQVNPVELLHKIRNGHPGAIMASMRAFPIEVSANVLAYAMTLPSR